MKCYSFIGLLDFSFCKRRSIKLQISNKLKILMNEILTQIN